MKRSLIVVLLILFSISSIGEAQRKRRRTSARSRTSAPANPCPSNLNDITACPDTGCGGRFDPNLNLRKNVRTDNQAAVKKDFQDLAALPDPVPGFKIGDTREKLTALGEGQMIRVMAYALVARRGSSETCNCHLTAAQDTDNHIVLIDPSLTSPTLAANEPESQTAEFTPRVRLDHPKLARANLQSLIAAAPNHVLLVRVTGLQMFDSEHSLGPLHLKRHNNWEIHPVMGLEFCPNGQTCTADNDANWQSLE
jgi:hypothetical protein